MARVITGALVAKAKANHYVMDRIKAQHFLQLNTKQAKTKLFIFAAANKLQISHCAMGLTVSCKNLKVKRQKLKSIWRDFQHIDFISTIVL